MKKIVLDNLPCVCLNNEYEPVNEKDGSRILKCSGCSLARTYPLPDASRERYREYGIDSYLKNKELLRPFMNDILNQAIQFKKAGRLLDIGCSVGYLLELAKEKGFDIFGVEPCQKAVKTANQLLDQAAVREGLLAEAGFENNYFDVIVMNHTLEHILGLENLFKELKRILKTDGIITIGVPNFGSLFAKIKGKNWSGLQVREHVWQFSPRALINFFDQSGFEVLKIKKTASYKFKQINSRTAFLNWLLGPLGLSDNLIICLKKK